MGMADDRQMKKIIQATYKNVPKDIIKLNEDLIHIVLGLHIFFSNEKKVLAWLKTKNPHFGGIEPVKLINMGKAKKIRQFIEDSLEGNFP